MTELKALRCLVKRRKFLLERISESKKANKEWSYHQQEVNALTIMFQNYLRNNQDKENFSAIQELIADEGTVAVPAKYRYLCSLTESEAK